MPLETYKAAGLLFNQNFLDPTSTPGLSGYRGELVLIPGEVADDKGHHKPPVALMRGAALLADSKIRLLLGALDDIAQLPVLLDRYQADFAEDMRALLYVVNIDKPAQLSIAGISFILIPLVQGVPWNEAIDELGLEKSDFKGQSAADKILTLYQELQGYQPNYASASLDEVLGWANDTRREGWGAV